MVLRPTGDRPHKQKLIERQFALIEIAFRRIETCFKVERRQHLPMQNGSTMATGEGKKLEDIERRHIEQILKETSWNVSRSAAILDIDRVTLYHKIEKYGLKREP